MPFLFPAPIQPKCLTEHILNIIWPTATRNYLERVLQKNKVHEGETNLTEEMRRVGE